MKPTERKNTIRFIYLICALSFFRRPPKVTGGWGTQWKLWVWRRKFLNILPNPHTGFSKYLITFIIHTVKNKKVIVQLSIFLFSFSTLHILKLFFTTITISPVVIFHWKWRKLQIFSCEKVKESKMKIYFLKNQNYFHYIFLL